MSEIREVLAKNAFRFNKRYGQNFITDTNLLDAIVSDADIRGDDVVLEIGPGAGTLTARLARAAKRVVAYEIDENLRSVLAETLADSPNASVVFKDVTKADDAEIERAAGKRYKLVANLPYYITTPIIMRFIECENRPESITVMVQKEVGDRLVAEAGSAEYGAITAAVRLEGGYLTSFAITDYTAAYGEALFWCGIAVLVFAPFLFLMYFMWDPKTIVDGANDNLTGCYMGIALMKALKDEGVEFENTEVGVIISGSEEAGLRGAKAWCKAHKDDYKDVETLIFAFDTIHEGEFLYVNDRDLNLTVKADRHASDLFKNSADELGINSSEGAVPLGATDSAAFNQGGFKATGITAMDHNLKDYYHTRRDSYDNLDLGCLADCYEVTVQTLKNFDEGK